MAKKSVDSNIAAYKNKGMKAPRPAAYGKEMNPSKAPEHKGAKHVDPSYGPVTPEMAKEAPSTMKKALTTKEAPEGVKGVNEGMSMDVTQSYCNPLEKK